MNRYLVFIFPLSLLCAKEIYMGETYEIVEPNPILEIKNKIKTNRTEIDLKIEKYKDRTKNKIENLENDFVINLPQAKKDDVWRIDTSVILQYDIPDGKGGVLYKKGYKYDPKDYLRFSRNIVVLNGNNKDEIKWAKEKGLFKNRHFKILITGGKIVPLMRTLHSKLYFYTKEIHTRFKLKHTPTIIRQEKDKSLYAYEFNIDIKGE